MLRALIFSQDGFRPVSWAQLFSLQTHLQKHLGTFWKFPGEPQNQSRALGEVDQSKALWCSVTADTCVGGRKGQVKALPPPVLLSLLCCQLGAFLPCECFHQPQWIFPVYLPFLPMCMVGRWNKAGAITGLCC